MEVQLHTFLTLKRFAVMPRQLYPREMGPRYPLGRRLDGLQSRSGRGEEERRYLPCPCRGSNPNLPARNLVSILTVIPAPHLSLSLSQHFIILLVHVRVSLQLMVRDTFYL